MKIFTPKLTGAPDFLDHGHGLGVRASCRTRPRVEFAERHAITRVGRYVN